MARVAPRHFILIKDNFFGHFEVNEVKISYFDCDFTVSYAYMQQL